MRADIEVALQILESQLKEADSSRGLSGSIRIRQIADSVDMVQESAERDQAQKMLDRESSLVEWLRSAIDRIKSGCYGVCLQCGEDIAATRLRAIPWAELCIRCQEQAEDLASQRERIPAFEDPTNAA